MFTQKNYAVTQGAAIPLNVVIRDATGTAIAYAGTETLVTKVWPGGAVPTTFTATTIWTSATKGAATATVSAAQTLAASPGEYQVLLTVTSAGGDPLNAAGCTLTILAGPTT